MNGREAVRPLVWMRALRDAAGVGGSRLAVLWALGLRMKKNGEGWATQEQLAGDTLTSVATVRRALDWAQDDGYLERLSRGHRLGDGRAWGSEYRLTLPASTAHGAQLRGAADEASTAHGETSTAQTDASTAHHAPTQGSDPQGSDSSSVPPFGGSPDGDLEELQDLESHNFKSAFDLGQHIAELCNEGKVQFVPEQFRDLAVAKFGFEGEREAWAGHHRYRCKPLGLCVCHDEVPW